MRASGILLPVSSLPSRFGIGCFSAEAYEFVDQLVRAGQRILADPASSDLPDMEIHHISLFPHLREIRILLIWKLL